MADWGNRARAVSGGALMGWEDELEAALRSGHISGPEYRAARDSIRQNYGQYEEAHPYEATGLSMAGSFAPFLVPGVGEVMMGGRGLAGAGRAIGVAAGQGALSGAGDAREVPDMANEAAWGGLQGAALGAVIPSALGGSAALKKAMAFRGKAAERSLYDLLMKYQGS
jgi:hypothetical protein